ncbi:MAG: preprotein translocase subunit YajC [Campylobacterales bacterium]|nr:preprotein translocase subunit YajC [Campylobacterales bacterium]
MLEGQSGGILFQIFPLILIFVVFYFLIIKPDQKRKKEHAQMVADLKKGDKIVTNGGLIAVVIKPEEDFIKIELNDNTIVKLDRSFVAKKVEIVEKA